MPATVLSTILSKAALTIVNSQTGIDVAANLKVVKVSFKFRARALRHMREDGNSIVDARIIVPAYVEIDAFCETLNDLALVNALILDRDSAYKVTSKGIVMDQTMAEENAIKQTPDVISANPVRIVLKQLLRQSGAASPVTEQPADSSILDKGIQTVNTALQSAQSAVNSAALTAQQLAQRVISNTGL
jgi:hypothetical protein